jgi:hypothetical protein
MFASTRCRAKGAEGHVENGPETGGHVTPAGVGGEGPVTELARLERPSHDVADVHEARQVPTRAGTDQKG